MRVGVWGVAGVAFVSLLVPWGTGGQAEPQFTFLDLTSDQKAIGEWAVSLFDQAGLDLPPIDFVRHSTREPCQGRAGIASYDQGRGQIGLCTPHARGVEEFLFLHELAHTWDRHSLAQDRREAFLDLRGLAAWRSPDLPWEELGTEQAAEIIVWGLIDRPVRIVRIPQAGCSELRSGYMILTGRAPLHGYADQCRT